MSYTSIVGQFLSIVTGAVTAPYNMAVNFWAPAPSGGETAEWGEDEDSQEDSIESGEDDGGNDEEGEDGDEREGSDGDEDEGSGEGEDDGEADDRGEDGDASEGDGDEGSGEGEDDGEADDRGEDGEASEGDGDEGSGEGEDDGEADDRGEDGEASEGDEGEGDDEGDVEDGQGGESEDEAGEREEESLKAEAEEQARLKAEIEEQARLKAEAEEQARLKAEREERERQEEAHRQTEAVRGHAKLGGNAAAAQTLLDRTTRNDPPLKIMLELLELPCVSDGASLLGALQHPKVKARDLYKVLSNPKVTSDVPIRQMLDMPSVTGSAMLSAMLQHGKVGSAEGLRDVLASPKLTNTAHLKTLLDNPKTASDADVLSLLGDGKVTDSGNAIALMGCAVVGTSTDVKDLLGKAKIADGTQLLPILRARGATSLPNLLDLLDSPKVPDGGALLACLAKGVTDEQLLGVLGFDRVPSCAFVTECAGSGAGRADGMIPDGNYDPIGLVRRALPMGGDFIAFHLAGTLAGAETCTVNRATDPRGGGRGMTNTVILGNAATINALALLVDEQDFRRGESDNQFLLPVRCSYVQLEAAHGGNGAVIRTPADQIRARTGIVWLKAYFNPGTFKVTGIDHTG